MLTKGGLFDSLPLFSYISRARQPLPIGVVMIKTLCILLAVAGILRWLWNRRDQSWTVVAEDNTVTPQQGQEFLHDGDVVTAKPEVLVLPDGLSEADLTLSKAVIGRATQAIGNMNVFSIAVMTITMKKVPPVEIFGTLAREFGARPDQVAYVLALGSNHTPLELSQAGLISFDDALKVVSAIREGTEFPLPRARITGAPAAVSLTLPAQSGSSDISALMDRGRQDTPVAGSPPTVIVEDEETDAAVPGPREAGSSTQRMAVPGAVSQHDDTRGGMPAIDYQAPATPVAIHRQVGKRGDGS